MAPRNAFYAQSGGVTAGLTYDWRLKRLIRNQRATADHGSRELT